MLLILGLAAFVVIWAVNRYAPNKYVYHYHDDPGSLRTLVDRRTVEVSKAAPLKWIAMGVLFVVVLFELAR